jgi:hypothetical protein
MMFNWGNLDNLDKLFVVWAFLFQNILIVHFALRKPFFKSYTMKFGWIVYALCIPAAVISIILWRGGKSWSFWLGGSSSSSLLLLVIGLIMCYKFHGETRFDPQ